MNAENTCPACGCHKNADREYCMTCIEYSDNLLKNRQIEQQKEQERKRALYFATKA